MGLFNWKKKEKPQREPLNPKGVEEKLRSFIATKSKMVKASELTPEIKLFTSGLLDSLTFVQLVTFIESEFQVSLSDHLEVNADNLDTLARIVKAIQTAW